MHGAAGAQGSARALYNGDADRGEMTMRGGHLLGATNRSEVVRLGCASALLRSAAMQNGCTLHKGEKKDVIRVWRASI
jgi:hypothetical protein